MVFPSPFVPEYIVKASDMNAINPLLDVVEVTSGTAASLQLTVPSGPAAVRVVGALRTNASAVHDTLFMTVNGIDSGYRVLRNSWVGNSATPSQSFTAAGPSWNMGAICAGANADVSQIYGSVDALLLFFPGSVRTRMHWTGGVAPTSTAADARHVIGNGHISSTATVTSIEFTASGGSFVVDSRLQLVRA